MAQPQQRFRFRNCEFNVLTTLVLNEPCVLLKDIRNRTNCNIESFTCNQINLAPLRDEHGLDKEPRRIRAFIDEIIDCDEPQGLINQTLHAKISLLDQKVDKVLDNTEILKKKANDILRQTYELAEFNVPRLFIVLPEETNKLNPLNLLRHSYRLFFLCECEAQRHLAFHEGYELQEPREFMKKYGPYLKNMLTVIKCALTAGSIFVPQLNAIASNISIPKILESRDMWDDLGNMIDSMNNILDGVLKEEKLDISGDFHLEGADLRNIEYFLKQKDDRRTFGNLYRMTSDGGHVRWVCIHHYDKYYSTKKKKELRQNFRRLGGIIREDEVTIDKDGSRKFDSLLNVINDGLHLFKLIIRDCELRESVFDRLLALITERLYIKCLELSSIKISRIVGFMYTHREIIKKLSEIAKKRADLIIKYVVEYPKDKPGPDPNLFDYALKTSTDNLLLQVYTRDDGKQIVLQDLNKSILLPMVKSLEQSSTIKHCSIIEFNEEISNCLLSNLTITKLTIFLVKFDDQKISYLQNFLSKRKCLHEIRLSKCENLSPLVAMLSQVLANNDELNVLALSGISDAEQILNLAAMLERNKHLIELNLAMDIHVNIQTLIRVSQGLKVNNTLKILKLTGIRDGEVRQDSGMNLFELFFRSTSIQQLTLNYRDHKPKISLFREAIQSSEIIQTLDLSNCNILPNKKLNGIYPINISNSLVSLSIHYCQLSFVDTVDLFRGIAQNSTLTTLYLSSLFIPSHVSNINLTTELAKMLETNKGLKKLTYSHGTLADKSVAVIAEALKSNRTLEELNFSYNRIGNEGAVALVDAINNNNVLVILNIQNNDIKYEGILNIFQSLQNNITLRHLYISQSSLKDLEFNKAKEDLLNVNEFINIY